MATKETRKVKGTAYLVGGNEEATKALINGIIAMTPQARKEEVAKLLRSKLVEDFELTVEVEVPATMEEAMAMLPKGRETVEKMVIAKAITNQYDKLRAAKVKELVDAANIGDLIGDATKK